MALINQTYTAWYWESEHKVIFGRLIRWVQALPETDERLQFLCRVDLNIPRILNRSLMDGNDVNAVSPIDGLGARELCNDLRDDHERLSDRLLQRPVLAALAYEVGEPGPSTRMTGEKIGCGGPVSLEVSPIKE